MYAILRTKKIKTRQQLKNQIGHASRTIFVTNADLERGKHNLCIVSSNYEAYAAEIESLKKRKDSVLGIDVFLGASPEFFSDMKDDPQKYRDWVISNKVFLEKEFGSENIKGLYLHLDESSPHFQALIIPRVGDRLNAGNWLNGKDRLKGLQDRYADSMQKYGLKRGLSGSKAHHTDIRQYYGKMNEIMLKERQEKQIAVTNWRRMNISSMNANEDRVSQGV